MTEPNIPPGFDFTDPDMYVTRVPAEELAELRRVAPVWWNAQPRGASGFDDEGYWVVTRHADVLEVSRRSDIYSSQEKTAIIRSGAPVSEENLQMQRLILLNLDPPVHTKLRDIVSRGFTPRAIGNLREALAERAGRIVQGALDGGTGDFVSDVACELPLQAIAELLGIPQEDRRKIFAWSNEMIGYDDPDYGGDSQAAAAELVGYSMAMAEDRRACPRDDIVTRLVHAEVDGGHLSPDEFGFFMILLSVAGNETTRNAISHGMLAFLDHPDQWELFGAGGGRSAVDEIVRWATPVTVFQRTALADTTLGCASRSRPASGSACSTGWPTSTRRSSTTPGGSTFRRSPNPPSPWVFGGTVNPLLPRGQPCRLEIELIFNAIADGMPDIQKAGEAERLRSGWLNGIKRLPVTYQ